MLLSAGVSVTLVSSVITAIITSIIVCLLMKKKLRTPGPLKTTPTHATPTYDTLTKTTGKDNIELRGNVAYATVNLWMRHICYISSNQHHAIFEAYILKSEHLYYWFRQLLIYFCLHCMWEKVTQICSVYYWLLRPVSLSQFWFSQYARKH